MRKRESLLVAVLLALISTIAAGQTATPSMNSSGAYQARVLRNNDVIRMVEEGTKSADILAIILTSHCNFDIFPPVLRDLRRRGVPDTVLMAMTAVPVGPPLLRPIDVAIRELTAQVQIPVGTVVEVETTRAFSSSNLKVGSPITFLVTKRIFVDKILVIERGAVARGHVVKVTRASGWGRPGMLAWEMDDVVAVDGTRVKINVGGTQSGKSRVAAVAGGALVTGAVVFPYTSPVALLWGLKKGDEAVLRGSRIFAATAGTPADVTGLRPRQGGVVYRDRETVKASAAPPTSTNFERGSFKFKGNVRPN